MNIEVLFYKESEPKPVKLGSEKNHHCYICNSSGLEYKTYLVATKDCKKFEKVIKMFKGLELNIKVKDPKFFSVELSYCREHKKNLEILEKLVLENGNFLTDEIIEISVEAN